MTFENWFQSLEKTIPLKSAHSVIQLQADGATIPFMARYRKEQTGNLDEVQIQRVLDLKEEYKEITDRQAFILSEVEKQGKMTDELKGKISTCFDKDILEDLYLPFKQKRKSKASLAREAGLEPLMDWILGVAEGRVIPEPGQTLELWAFTFHNVEKGFADAEKTIQGAVDLIVERASESLELRQKVRDLFQNRGFMRSKKGEKAKTPSKFQNYFEYEEKLVSLMEPKNSHRYLAIRRGWIEEELSISFGGSQTDTSFEEDLYQPFLQFCFAHKDSPVKDVLTKAARVALKAHVLPSIENEFHKKLKEVADQVAIQVFSENVRKILLAAPYGPKGVLGVDPGIRTGCKLAVIDASGKFLADTVIRLQTEAEKKQAAQFLKAVCESGQITAIAVGNGTAGRETETFIRETLRELNLLSLPVVMVSESGASIYSASAVAREEFPDLDVTVRGAISIARRFQDPLAELVKIDPKSIGVGQYQHDVSQTALKRALDLVVDSCVNAVGVNLNTGSIHLLAHVSGIGDGLAKAIVEHREKEGLFKSREDLLKVSRFSKKVFEQAAGFLRVPESENPLDNTGVHPERYADLEAIAKSKGLSIKDLIGPKAKEHLATKEAKEKLGEFTAKDVLKELEKPGRDPRDSFVPVQFRVDLKQVSDVKAGMICPGVVTNVTNFGAFVDIGVHQDGLVHISQLGNRFVSDPSQVVSPGDRVTVKVLEVNLEKNQMAFTMRMDQKEMPTSLGQTPKKLVVQIDDGTPKIKPRPAGEGHRPQSRPQHQSFQSRGGQDQRPRPQPKPAAAFNNAFAGLAALKDQMKK